ncbi:DNA adenine methylase [Sphingomonas nostoxanthinifaciens]|uniref:DNA adenine methylase n=1 Tax=Sphingomonas nostoxanthinifaciens TaxID=2872652 RepID=UPI001CC205DA|nr:DNA adenine methylase [Sphingomonas nostoxanthinifaciens]UAK24165.1 DNA adenine methylase [Sphingomonas nostoxanthinifaciens]
MESILSEVRPVSPAAPYLGGKRNLASRIVSLIRSVPHRTYVEPFVGMGGIFLRRDRRAPVEVINDLSGDVATLFRILQRHYQAFMDLLKWQLTSRAEFERLRATAASSLTDLERAARFLYLQRLAFGGKIEGRTFGVDRRTPGRFDVTKLEPMLMEIHERLAGVVIEQLPYTAAIEQYDSAETLFYLDPPYWGCESDYGAAAFSRSDFACLADLLDRIEGQFVLSINATDGAREVFSRFDCADVETTYTVSSGATGEGKRATELIVSRLAPGRLLL